MSQTITNIRCVIVDDGSTDNTEEVVREAIKNDSRFFYIRQDNAGVAEARNRGVFSDEARNSKYVCCLDADDALDPRFLEACVSYLEKNPRISIAYTGLYYITPDGKEGLSEWPGDSDYNRQLEGKNQIPTCNVMRREVWNRLGGQRQRYAPDGAGEEDAEMWLRAGAYGFRAKKVTDAGLFIYSWLSGRVSGAKDHRMVDYRSWHPWTKDAQPPFVSIANPNGISHPVRQYDEPVISVVIPVGPRHAKNLVSALDSLDAQTFRRWEAIVVWDTPEDPGYILRTFPHIRLVENETPAMGAGYSRNRGVEYARAPLLLFLDADDWLHPEALAKMFTEWERTGEIIYTDYVGKAEIDETLAEQLRSSGRLLEYDPKSKMSVIAYSAFDYDCELASKQPSREMYHWCLVTTLMPIQYHFEIGGFDEGMESWEDWEYYIRLARAGKCFHRLAEKLVIYRFYSGNRREDGLKAYESLVEYMLKKFGKGKPMACGCGKKSGLANKALEEMVARERSLSQPERIEDMSDDNFLLVRYNHPNTGQHRVIGAATQTDYGYRGGGEEFLVHKSDVAVAPHIFIPVAVQHFEAQEQAEAVALPSYDELPPAPEKIEEIKSNYPTKTRRPRKPK